jgi:purine nucleosidase
MLPIIPLTGRALFFLCALMCYAPFFDIAVNAAERTVPVIPPKEKQIRVIIDTDAKNEIDDQWAIALAILSPERFKIEGFVAAPYLHGGLKGVEKSAKEIKLVLDKAGMSGKWPVKRGSHPLQYPNTPSESEGVDFIIRKAMESTPDDPLWVIGLGAATNIASAYLKEPRIADRVVVFWHFRTKWPDKCWNFNVFGDIHAARTVFHSNLPFVLFDTGTHLDCPMSESEKSVRPHGELGRYLHDYRLTSKYFMGEKKGFFDLGDIAGLLDPEIASWEEVACPEVDWDLTYRFKGTRGRILRCFDIDRDKTFKLLYTKLSSASVTSWAPPTQLDLLVFAPHPDDEVLGCAGVILQALEEQKRVGIVILTSGDGFPKAASIVTNKSQDQLTSAEFLRLAAERQQQSLDSLAILGVPKANLMFLGYPDSGLTEIYRGQGTLALRQKFADKNHTYGIMVSDYHSAIHGHPAPYTRTSILADIADIIEICKPKEIYVTHEMDRHPDHRAAHWFVRDAARVAGYRGKLFTYVVHGKEQPKLPVHRVSLTVAQVKKKRAAIVPHQIPIVHDNLGSHAKEEEVFWLSPIETPLKKKTP